MNGRETILINAVDWNDNEAVRELVLYEDESGPYINIVDPGNYTQVSDQVTVTAAVGNGSEEPALLSEVASITWEVIDPGFLAETILFDSSLKDGTTTQIPPSVTLDTSIPASTDPYNETTYSFYTFSLSGQKWVKVTAEDWQGHSSEAVIALIINASGPYLAVSGPADNDKYHGTVNVTGVVQNSSSNTGLEYVDYLQCDILGYSGVWVKIDFDNVTPANPPTITASSGSGTFDQLNNTFDVLLNTSGISDSFLRINVRAVDTGGEITDDSIDLVEDTGGPQLSITTPSANDDYGTSVTLSGNVKSYSGAPDASEVSSLEYSINGSTVDILSSLDSASGNFSGISVDTAGCSGPKTLRVTAEDQNGHISSVDIALTDGLPPSLSISQPTTSYEASTTVSGSVLDYAGASSAASVDSVSYSLGGLNGTLSFSSSTGAISDSIDCSSLTGAQTLTIDAVDDYGNSLAAPISLSLTDGIKPEFESASITTVAGTANDTISIVFSEDVLEADAETASKYRIELNGDNDTIDLAGAVYTYTAATHTVEIRLADGDQPDTDSGSTVRFDTGTSYDIEVSGIRDLNGNTMDGTQTRTVTASGDAAAPTVSSVVQNTSIDSSGKTIDVTFSEAVDESEAGTDNFYSLSGTGAPNLSSAVVQSATVVRLVFNAEVTPGTHSLSISGASIHDLAGNALAAVSGRSITDTTAPAIVSAGFTTASGAENDTVSVTFSEDVEESGAETAANYRISDGTDTLIISDASFVYSTVTDTLTITLLSGDRTDTDESAGKTRLNTGTSYTVTVNNIQDISGNTIAADSIETAAATGDSTAPTVSSAVQNTAADATGKTVDVTFSEAVDKSEAGTSTHYSISGTDAPSLSSLTVESATLVRLVFDAAVTPGTHTLNITPGSICDLAGNAIGDSGDITIE